MRIRKYNTSSILSFFVTLTICMQNPIWIFWKSGTIIGYMFAFLLLLFLMKNHCVKLRFLDLIICAFFFLIFLYIPFFYDFRFSSIFILVSYFVGISLDEDIFRKSLSFISKYLYYIILISLPAWLIHLYVYEFPLFGELDLSEMKGTYSICNNYLLFVTNPSSLDLYRFYSMFDEPGVLGTLSAFVLYGNKYDFSKKENIVILIGSLFTYSMTFYLLTLIGWIYQSMCSLSLRKILLSIALIIGTFSILFFFLSEDEAFQRSVLDRFSEISFNQVENRTGDSVNAFWGKYITSTDCILGMGTSFLGNFYDFGNSYKRFIIEYGLLGTILLLVMYLRFVREWNRLVFGFFIIFVLSFLQRPYAFSAWQIFIFIAVISNLYSKQNHKYLILAN